MKFVLDENVSPELAVVLRSLGEDVDHLTDHWKAGTRDTVWLPLVGKKGWIVLSFDHELMRNKPELKLFRRHHVGGFQIVGKAAKGFEIARQLLYSWGLIKELAEKEQPPFYFRLPEAPVLGDSFRRKVVNLLDLEVA